MSKVKKIIYTKSNGDASVREIIEMSKPRKNVLALDVTSLGAWELETLVNVFLEIDEFREDIFKEWELSTGLSLSSFWRTFKPEGIEKLEDEETGKPLDEKS